MELNNYELVKNIDDSLIDIIVISTNRKRVGTISVCPSKYKEGRIMSNSDKSVSIRQIKNVSSATALISGNNKSLKK